MFIKTQKIPWADYSIILKTADLQIQKGRYIVDENTFVDVPQEF
jgi:hypothetical protein